ncbi:MAG TPA: signal recognition particle protein [Candidatus Altiarchaeales archaeon]|nr:signal recognition particle protein [Candidatus Altiarchaeales archaeon]
MVFDKLRDGFQGAVKGLRKAVVVDKKAVKEFTKEIQKTLLSSDVNVKLVLELSKKIEERGLLEKPPGALDRRENIIRVTYEEIVKLVGTGGDFEVKENDRILMVGVQGSGKTTTSGKLASYFKKKGLNPRLICADTFRPAAYDQLKQIADEIHVPFYGDNEEKKSLKIIERGIQKFGDKGLVIIDSEGRHKLNKELMDDINEVYKKIRPDKILLVLDSTIGQQAGEQAKAFKESTRIDGLILSKMDGTAKGGGALSACAVTGAPIYFIGVGERTGDIEAFIPQRFVSKMLGFGDMEGLLEKAQQIDFDEESAKRMIKGQFDLNDLYEQIEQMNSMGSLDKLMEMLPFKMNVPDEAAELQQEKMSKFKIIMDSMTPAEMADPSIIKKDRVERIAKGSGTSAEEVRELLSYYKRMKKMMKGMGGGRQMKRMMKKMGMGGMGM